MEFTFKKALASDIEYLLWLREETMTPHLLKAGFKVDRENHYKALNYKFEGARIIFHGDERVGLIKTSSEENFIEIIQFQIAPEFQRRGFGRKIIRELIAEAPDSIDSLFLSVLKENNARKLYEKCGFVIVGENEHSFEMRLDI
ncbi:GNAT family N-acetyltransferase [Fulvivirga sp. 29W222]|uniref:GNAT family N-acetyltransferase n=1 Tax=Fulvivirga marina TaxID=2494733 RepID=A0A937KF58_9BACT|nr:GNAT family N-acetyltransferase [Fulvivirga marina]MBL6447905.1 GNAT family N-acetyltransferase [Fulvivirga marina]